MTKVTPFLGMLGAWLVVNAAASVNAATVTWDFQLVASQANPADQVLAMSIGNGAKWPAVFYRAANPPGQPLMAASLSPAGWVHTRLGSTVHVTSAAGPDGRIGATWNGQFAQSTGPGWAVSTTPIGDTTDVAYLSGNRPVVVGGNTVASSSGSGWDIDTITANPTTPQIDGVAVDRDDNLGLACVSHDYRLLSFVHQDRFAGTWDSTDILAVAQRNLLIPSIGFGSDNVPGIAYVDTSTLGGPGDLYFTSFDVQSGTWHTGLVAADIYSRRVNLEYNSLGHAALAYVDSERNIHYRINDGGGWADVILPRGRDPVSGLQIDALPGTPVELAFDCNDLPVLAYYGVNGVMLAYDPIVTPEPGSLGLLAVTGMWIWQRGRRRARPT